LVFLLHFKSLNMNCLLKICKSLTAMIAFASLLAGCDGVGGNKQKSSFPNTDMYDLHNPVVVNLPADLDEISGIAYYAKDTSVFAIVDEIGLLYKIPIMRPNEITKWPFDDNGDFEDIVLKDSSFYVLVSNGDVMKLDFEGTKVIAKKLNLSAEGKKTNEFESMYLSGDSSTIVIMCKDCKEDKKMKVSEYSFNADDDSAGLSLFREIAVSPIAQGMGETKLNLKASAAAINPITGDLYVVASVNKTLIILDSAANFKKAYKLDPKIYKQPEGIAFTPNGDLIITNEVFLEGYANLLIMKNKKKK
jgi:DNA-binding beta-propeller fold protein YncE